MPNLKRVIIPVSYFSLYDPPFEDSEVWYMENFYKIYMGIDKYRGLSKHSFEMSYFPLFSGRIQSKILRKKIPECSAGGFGLDYALSARDNNWKSTALSACKRHTYRDFSDEAYNAAWLDSIFSLCEKHRYDIILITTPKHSAYRDILNKEQYRRTGHVIDSLMNGRKVTFLDFSADRRFRDPDFYDTDHLSDYGARHFTAILRDTLRSMHCL